MSDDTVHLVVCSLAALPGEEETRGIAQILDRAERDRIERLEKPDLRRRRTVAAAFTRVAVAGVLDVDVADVAITRSERGAPIVAQPEGTGLNISMSHAFPWIAFAASKTLPVGVDVEDARRVARSDLRRIRAASPAEREHLAAMTDEAAAHAQGVIWVAKEAVLKATGLGMAIPLTTVTVDVRGAAGHPLADGARIEGEPPHAGAYDTWTHWLPDRFVLALAAPALRRPARVEPRDLRAGLRGPSPGAALEPWLQQAAMPRATMSRRPIGGW